MIIYTNLMPDRFAGYTIGPIVLIRPKYKDDKGLEAHELTHVKQFWHNPLMGLWYLFSKKSRLAYEVEAYRAQLTVSPGNEDRFAGFLVSHYNLNITLDDAKKLLH